MNQRPVAAFLLAGVGLVSAFAEAADTDSNSANPGAKSGYEFLSPEGRALQDDDFANPGMLWVEEGERLWKARTGAAAKSCSDCHGDARQSMRAVATRYPVFSPEAGQVINLDQRINLCRVGQQKTAELHPESKELLSLSAYVTHQAKGLAMNVAIDGQARQSFERGREFFYRRRGQLNLSCASCHEQNVGRHLRAEPISQGQVNGFPIYRQLWQTLGSLQRMFAWCNEAVRAEPYAPNAQEYVDLELYERWRGRGLKIETPAIRR